MTLGKFLSLALNGKKYYSTALQESEELKEIKDFVLCLIILRVITAFIVFHGAGRGPESQSCLLDGVSQPKIKLPAVQLFL